MPSLIRLLVVLGLLVGAAYAGMWALATFVQVTPHPIEQTIPAAKLK